jgi:hypothetical protein
VCTGMCVGVTGVEIVKVEVVNQCRCRLMFDDLDNKNNLNLSIESIQIL